MKMGDLSSFPPTRYMAKEMFCVCRSVKDYNRVLCNKLELLLYTSTSHPYTHKTQISHRSKKDNIGDFKRTFSQAFYQVSHERNEFYGTLLSNIHELK